MKERSAARFIVIVSMLISMVFCGGCSPPPVKIQNDTDVVLGAVFMDRVAAGFDVKFRDYEYIDAGESTDYRSCHRLSRTGYVKIYTREGLVGIWPARCGDEFTVSKGAAPDDLKVVHNRKSRDYGAFPVNTYAVLNYVENWIPFLVWIGLMSSVWFVLICLVMVVESWISRIRKENKTLIYTCTRNLERKAGWMFAFIVVAILLSYIISGIGVHREHVQEDKYIEKIRALEQINVELSGEFERTFCRDGKTEN